MQYNDRIQEATHPLAKELLQLMHEKKTNLSFAADVTGAAELLRLVEACGPYICVLKTHIDIIDDFTPVLIDQLTALAAKHEFMIFEDRKFADIGNTVTHQYGGGVYRIADWAKITNAHVVSGPGIIQGLAKIGQSKGNGLLLLAQMSSAGHLMSDDYVQQTVAMAEDYPEFVMGFIAQQKISDNPGLIHMTPGVKFAPEGDQLLQLYNTPEKIIVENQSDIIIVGRDIIQAVDPAAQAQKYRDVGFAAYKMR